MKADGKYHHGNRVRAFASWALLLIGVATGAVSGGCRSSRNAVEESTTIEHNKFDTSEQKDSVHSETNDSIYQRDTIKGCAGERGRIDIERDTAGRPVSIYWFRYFGFNGFGESLQTTKNLFTLRSASNSSNNTGAVDSITKKKEETQEEVNPTIPVESLVGAGVKLLVIFCVIFVLIRDYLLPWIKKLRR